MTLTEFLLARIAEDEEAARGMLPPSPWVYAAHPAYEGDDNWSMSQHHVRYVAPEGGYECRVADVWHEDVARFIARHSDPARVLAECEAKRNLVNYATFMLKAWADKPGGAYPDMTRRERSTANVILEQLAAIYTDHSDYCEEWKP